MSLVRFGRTLMLVSAVGISAVGHAADGDTRFDIRSFKVDGNTILSGGDVEQLVAPFVGQARSYGDVQRALEALEKGYRERGYGTVQVYVPEQELTKGVVRLQVTEGVIGKVAIKGNKYFNDANIRAAVPQLQEGKAPNMKLLSENVQLANENPARQVELILGVSEEEGKVNARLDVTEDDPQRVFLTLDDTGNNASGLHRIGLSYQNANLFNSDQVITLAYITSPDQPHGVKNDIFSVGYRMPLYNLGDSVDVIYANSASITPSNVGALGSAVGINGKGEVFGLRYNHIFPRQGEYVSRLVGGFDYKYINSTCSTAGVKTAFGIAGCTPYTVRPLSLTYSGKVERPGLVYDYFLGVMHNFFPMGADYDLAGSPGTTDKYSAASGYRVKNHFSAARFGGSLLSPMSNDWMWRLALNGQISGDALVSGERLGLAGVNAVRGFRERADGGVDSGFVLNVELYTPEFGDWLGIPGNLKGLVFYDAGQGRNNNDDPAVFTPHIAAVGVGLRYNFKKDVTFRYDFAQVVDGHAIGSGAAKDVIEGYRDTRGHFALAISF